MVENFMGKNPKLRQELPSQDPLGRLGKPQEMRGVALWLAEDVLHRQRVSPQYHCSLTFRLTL